MDGRAGVVDGVARDDVDDGVDGEGDISCIYVDVHDGACDVYDG